MCWGSERGFRAPTSRTDWTPPTWWCLPLPQGLSTDSADGARHTPNSVSQDCGLPASHTELPGVWATLQQSTRETLAGCPMPPEPPARSSPWPREPRDLGGWRQSKLLGTDLPSRSPESSRMGTK